MIPPTPLEEAPGWLAGVGRVFLKREDSHEHGSLKWRGALPVLEGYLARGAKGVITASTGNHGAATAWAARRLGLDSTVYAPLSASRAKLAIVESLGARIRLAGKDLDEAKDEARDFARKSGLPFFEDGAEPAQYEGYGAIAAEILSQCPRPPAAIVIPVGNGALIGGIGSAVTRQSPQTLVVGVTAKEAPVMALSFEAGRPVPCDRMATFADGLAVRVAIPYAVEILRRVADRVLLVSEREIARGLGAAARCALRVEGAAAAAFAALPRLEEVSGPIVLVVTGKNIDEETYLRALQNPESFPE
ncbi:MAG TPA: pyridoxal-phosphate dependent enzyme [Thermoanaerobaculia bacterium]|nr:pyridoxal-phosphate dependent enzyme [Thermoanaerobaculia bacterium]